MTATVELPEYLVEFRKQICSHCLLGEPAAAAFLQDECVAPSLRQTLVLAAPPEHRANLERLLENSRLPPCDQCDFLLLVDSLKDLVPVDDFPAWLKQPDPDLDGRTPAECVDGHKYEAVFRALWMIAPPGPVS